MIDAKSWASGLIIVVPVLNGAPLLATCIEGLRPIIIDRNGGILFVDDGSSDDTWAFVCQLASEYPDVRGVRLAENVGQARALWAGLSALDDLPPVVATIDVDLETFPSDLPLLIDAVQAGADLASGRRGSRRSWARELPSRCFNVYVRTGGVRLRDVGCGTNAMSRQLAERYRAWDGGRRTLPAALLVTHATSYVEVEQRSTRPRSSQLGPMDLVRLWVEYDITTERNPEVGLWSVGGGAFMVSRALRRRYPRVHIALTAAGVVAVGIGSTYAILRRRVARADSIGRVAVVENTPVEGDGVSEQVRLPGLEA